MVGQMELLAEAAVELSILESKILKTGDNILRVKKRSLWY